MKLVRLLMLLALTASKVVHAQEHPACSNLEYHYEDHASEQLRSIAASCKSTSIANPYYNRAHHSDLTLEAATLTGLINYYDNSSRVGFEAYYLYMALLEQMARIWYPDTASRVAFLNREHDQHGEIAGLRPHGYDLVADHLERAIISDQVSRNIRLRHYEV